MSNMFANSRIGAIRKLHCHSASMFYVCAFCISFFLKAQNGDNFNALKINNLKKLSKIL